MELIFGLGFLFISLIGTLLHFTYDLTNHNKLVALFSAVNESTWEHIKIALTPFFIWSLVDGFIYGIHPNYFLAKAGGALTIIILIPLLFYSYKSILKKSLLGIDITIFYVAILLGQIVSYFILKINPLSFIYSYLSIIILFIIFGLYLTLTLAPVETNLFLDPISKKYGIKGHSHCKK